MTPKAVILTLSILKGKDLLLLLAPDQQPNGLHKIPSRREPHPMLHLNFIRAAGQWMHRKNPARVHNMPPMNPQELPPIKPLLDAAHRLVQQMCLAPAMQLNIVISRFNPVHRIRRNKLIVIRLANHEPLLSRRTIARNELLQLCNHLLLPV